MRAHFTLSAQPLLGQERPHPEHLPRQSDVAFIVEPGSFKVLAADLQLRVIEKDFPLAQMQPAPRHRLTHHPLDELAIELLQGIDTFTAVRTQPLPDRCLICKPFDPSQTLGQGISIELLAVGQAVSAGAHGIEQLRQHHFRPEAPIPALTRIQCGHPFDTLPEPKLLRHGFDGGQTAQRRGALIGDEFDFEGAVTFGNGRHKSKTRLNPNCSKFPFTQW